MIYLGRFQGRHHSTAEYRIVFCNWKALTRFEAHVQAGDFTLAAEAATFFKKAYEEGAREECLHIVSVTAEGIRTNNLRDLDDPCGDEGAADEEAA